MKTTHFILGLGLILVGAKGHAWSEHGLLTREALSTMAEVKALAVEYQPLAKVIPLLKINGVKTPADLNHHLKIKRESAHHHAFEFEPRLAEKPGSPVAALDVLSHYSDEPDGWKDTHAGDEPDTVLFDEDQYPELWKPEYAMLGGREGIPSQAFRHMWWGPLQVTHPLASFKLPFGKLTKPMGEAPERLLTYLKLSRAAKAAGSRYWQLRFLANALHYVQDCTQPFHVSQTPSKKFLWMASPAGGWRGAKLGLDVITKRTTQLVAYYHFSYEDFIGRIFKRPDQFAKSHRAFSEALKKRPAELVKNPEEYVKEVAEESVARSPVAARTAINFFPPIPKDQDLATFDPSAYMTDAWWAQVEASAESDSKVQRKYFNSVKESFELFGKAVRSLVKTELSL